MKTPLITMAVTLIFLFLVLGGCNDLNNISSEEEKFIGTWVTIGENPLSFNFSSDGTGSFSGASLNWELKDGKFVIKLMPGEVIFTYDYSFLDNGNTLTLTDLQVGKSLIYYKQ